MLIILRYATEYRIKSESYQLYFCTIWGLIVKIWNEVKLMTSEIFGFSHFTQNRSTTRLNTEFQIVENFLLNDCYRLCSLPHQKKTLRSYH